MKEGKEEGMIELKIEISGLDFAEDNFAVFTSTNSSYFGKIGGEISGTSRENLRDFYLRIACQIANDFENERKEVARRLGEKEKIEAGRRLGVVILKEVKEVAGELGE